MGGKTSLVETIFPGQISQDSLRQIVFPIHLFVPVKFLSFGEKPI